MLATNLGLWVGVSEPSSITLEGTQRFIYPKIFIELPQCVGHRLYPEISAFLNLAFGGWIGSVNKQTYKGMSDASNFYKKQPGRSILCGFWRCVAIFDEMVRGSSLRR